MRLGITLLLANVMTIVCLVLAYLLVEHGHPGFAVAFIAMAVYSFCSPQDNNKG